jgi:hypothetical protein
MKIVAAVLAALYIAMGAAVAAFARTRIADVGPEISNRALPTVPTMRVNSASGQSNSARDQEPIQRKLPAFSSADLSAAPQLSTVYSAPTGEAVLIEQSGARLGVEIRSTTGDIFAHADLTWNPAGEVFEGKGVTQASCTGDVTSTTSVPVDIEQLYVMSGSKIRLRWLVPDQFDCAQRRPTRFAWQEIFWYRNNKRASKPNSAADSIFARTAGQSTLTNDDVLAFFKAGLPDSVVVAKIQSSDCRFDTSAGTLLKLQAQSIPEAVLVAMVQAGPTVVRGSVQSSLPAGADENDDTARVFVTDSQSWSTSGVSWLQGLGARWYLAVARDLRPSRSSRPSANGAQTWSSRISFSRRTMC